MKEKWRLWWLYDFPVWFFAVWLVCCTLFVLLAIYVEIKENT